MNNLLKVLDMSEGKEQDNWLQKYAWHHRTQSQTLEDFHRDCKSGHREISLADLAFSLRNEVKSKVEFHHCFAKVCKHIDPHIMNYAGFALCTAKPIHWIIAALMAKEKENESNQNP